MKAYCKVSLLGMILLFISQISLAQTLITGEVRPRTEYNHGAKTLATPGQEASTTTSQRTRLNMQFANENMKFKVALQDVRMWGSQKQLVGNEANSVSVHEAWGEILFSEKFSLRAGRQELVYDNHRIFGSVGWAQQARSHDLALFKYEGAFNAHLGIAHHESGGPNNLYLGADAYKDMQFLWLNNAYDNASASFLFLNNGKPVMNAGKQEVEYSQTIGGQGTFNVEGIKIEGNIYYQTGKDGLGNDLSAYDILIDASLKLSENSGISLGYELLSGTAFDEAAGKNKSFAPLYGTNHKFNGFMDYFFVGNHMNNVGLSDLHLKYGQSYGKWSVKEAIHYFSSAAAIDADNGAFSYLGTELDFNLSYAVAPGIGIAAGFSQLFGADTMEILKGGDKDETSNWGYVMITLKPTLFKN